MFLLFSLSSFIPGFWLLSAISHDKQEIATYEAKMKRRHELLPMLSAEDQELLLSYGQLKPPARKNRHMTLVGLISALIAASGLFFWPSATESGPYPGEMSTPTLTPTPTPTPTPSPTPTSETSDTPTPTETPEPTTYEEPTTSIYQPPAPRPAPVAPPRTSEPPAPPASEQPVPAPLPIGGEASPTSEDQAPPVQPPVLIPPPIRFP